MIDTLTSIKDMLAAPVRALRGRVEVYTGNELSLMCGCHDSLQSFTVERIGESKFFGYGICQKINVKLIDRNRDIDISTANTLEVVFGVGSDYIYPFPNFYITDVYRDENDNGLSITAYDALYNASKHTISEVELVAPYTLGEAANACASFLGIPLNDLDESFNLLYETGANFEGSETLRDVFNAIAEATQTIYFVNWDWKLTFKRLDGPGAAVSTISKDLYYTLDSGTNRRLSRITHTTELSDNVTADTGVSGTTQYIRNNPFIELREDIGDILNAAIDRVGGLTINQFSCDWRGNFLLEIADKVELITKENNSVFAYVLNDSISFDGALSQVTEWSYSDNDSETEANPTSIGDALKQTYARVDKANKQIEMVVSEVDANRESISALELNTEGISATVSRVEQQTEESLAGITDEIATLTSTVETKVSAQDVTIQISSALDNGVSKVETSTGFTFNEEGLTIAKSGREMTTTISENGMIVYRDVEAVLIADNEGVKAEDLHATTYLIVGKNSRFEDFGDNRTGCFWIGGIS